MRRPINPEGILEFRRLLLEQAKSSGNVAETCRLFGVSRALYYKLLHKYEKEGDSGLMQSPIGSPRKPRKVTPFLKARVINLAIERPWETCVGIANALNAFEPTISHATVQAILNANGLGTLERRAVEAERALMEGRIDDSRLLWSYLTSRNRLVADLHGFPKGVGEIVFLDWVIPSEGKLRSRFQIPPNQFSRWLLLVFDGWSGFCWGISGDQSDGLNVRMDFLKRTAEELRLLRGFPSLMVSAPIGMLDSWGGRKYQGCIKEFQECFPNSEIVDRTGRTYISGRGEIFLAWLEDQWRSQVAAGTSLWRLEETGVQLWIDEYNRSSVVVGFPNFGTPPIRMLDLNSRRG